MIIRILGEGQWELDEEHLDALRDLDNAVEQSVEAGDQMAFAEGLAALLHRVRSEGTCVDDEVLEESDLILPMSDASLEEVRGLMTEQGLVPDA